MAPPIGDEAVERHAPDRADDAGMGVAPHLVGLAVACVLALALWRALGDPGREASSPTAPPGMGGGTDSSPPGATSPAGVPPRAPSAGTAAAEDDAGFPAREPLAGLIGAWERFGGAFTIRHPAYLPPGVAPFTVNWQPDADPRRQAAGYGDLLSWYSTPADGVVLVLVQGPGVGIRPLTAPDDRAGRLRLADGTDVIWVVGHPLRVTSTRDGLPSWDGTEITLGVAVGGGEGWYLRSDSLSLAELVRVAESLRPFDGGR